jgi:tRNA pseudouridine55 synthase
VDKPAGPTSHDIVARVRKVLGVRRVGHTGTLDPFASGLLLLLVGRVTRLAQYLDDLPKEYVARARLGQRTTTDDVEGEVAEESEAWRDLSPDRITRVLEGFLGEGEQLPPVFSAKKVQGEAAHRKARRGEGVTLSPVRIRIHEMELQEVDLPHVTFRVVCSTGTYIRALARDAGRELGVGAHLVALRRTRIGAFSVEEATPGDALETGAGPGEAAPGSPHEARWRRAWRTPLELVAHLPRISVDPEGARRLAAGQVVLTGGGEDRESIRPGIPAGIASGPDTVAVALDDRLVAVAEREGSRLRPRKVFLND